MKHFVVSALLLTLFTSLVVGCGGGMKQEGEPAPRQDPRQGTRGTSQ